MTILEILMRMRDIERAHLLELEADILKYEAKEAAGGADQVEQDDEAEIGTAT